MHKLQLAELACRTFASLLCNRRQEEWRAICSVIAIRRSDSCAVLLKLYGAFAARGQATFEASGLDGEAFWLQPT